MEPSNTYNLSNKILDDPTHRMCEIYKITCLTSKKIYIGQAVTHILNHKKYRPYGMDGRFRCHISEAFSKKKNQCHYLNNAIRKYGPDDFTLELLHRCTIEDADNVETQCIQTSNSLFPMGYNLNTGGNVFRHTDESRKRVSKGVMKYNRERKFERFMGLTEIDDNFEKYIKPLNRFKKQYGWYVFIKGIKADFGGVHITLTESKEMARMFIFELSNRLAKRLVAGKSLEHLTTTS